MNLGILDEAAAEFADAVARYESIESGLGVRLKEEVKSVEGDTYPKDHPEKAIEVDGAIGELSPFHREFGYYAHGVAPETATLPDGWDQRLVEFPVKKPS